uniref:Family with sequence similarity 234 member A n=1 Tax=Cynoglossus semilaevis TaxID=244447 RepID=A0A3P8WP01_CYNSE
METTDHATEGDPLKRGEDGLETVAAPSGAEQKMKKKKSCKEILAFVRANHWRTAVFFFSLFLCLTIVFAFSFILPCPVRPQYLISWNRSFSHAETYDFLAVESASEDQVMDVTFVVKMSESSKNCTDEGLPSPCLFVIAVDGTDGETLWERPLRPEFHWAQCGLQTSESSRTWDCLLSHSDQISALDKKTGEIKWQCPHPPGFRSVRPVLSTPDLDGDAVGDVALVRTNNATTQLVFLSGKNGIQIGSSVSLSTSGTQKHLLQRTPKSSRYVVLQQDTGLYGLALRRIAAKAKAGMEKVLRQDDRWEKNANPTSGLIPIYNEPYFGHFNKDGLLDVVIEEDVGNNNKRIVIIDGKSGLLLWEYTLLAASNSPRPATIHTSNFVSIFVFWGTEIPAAATTIPAISQRHSFMLHPVYPQVLLKSTNVVDHIVAFTATLLERGRHAAYFLLTGPATEGVQGTVILRKRKLKQDVPQSKVLSVGGVRPSEEDEDIKEAFNRLRFSDN